jgi:hypothetical protein
MFSLNLNLKEGALYWIVSFTRRKSRGCNLYCDSAVRGSHRRDRTDEPIRSFTGAIVRPSNEQRNEFDCPVYGELFGPGSIGAGWLAAYKGGVALLDVSRGSEPVLMLTMDGKVKTGGGLEDKVAQARLAEHAQVIEHKLAEGTQAAQTRPGPVADGRVRNGAARPALGQSNAMQGPSNLPMLMVLQPNDPKARPWVEDAVRTILDEGGDVIDAEIRDAAEEYE